MKIPVGWCVLIAVVLTFLGCIGYIPTHHAWKAARVAWAIKRNLPTGSSRAQVIELLDRHKVERSSEGKVAIVRNVGQGFFCTMDMLLIFTFDGRGQMTSYEVEMSATCV